MALVVLDVLALVAYFRDSSSLAALARDVSGGDPTLSVRMRRLAEFVSEDVPRGRVDDYFLLPIFRPLKPTARQVIEGGGDCAYKARAFIVLARSEGIEASKLALYDDSEQSIHAVALVATERGEYVVDLSFGVIYDLPNGDPVSVRELSRDPQLQGRILDRKIEEGNSRASRYPRQKYVYRHVRTINWHKNRLSTALYHGLSAIFGEQAIDRLPRPYLSEEPALMVIVLSCCTKAILAFPWFLMQLIARIGSFLGRGPKGSIEFSKTAAAR